MKFFTPKLLTTALAMAMAYNAAMADNWITQVDDEVYVSQLSIPGTHDSATGEGFQGGLGFLGKGMAQTQDLTLSEQWDCGIRAFDLRPTVKQDGDSYILQIYHGIIETKMSFDNALTLLRDKLVENPGEFAIVIMRHESDANSSIQDKWDSLMTQSLKSESLAGYLQDFKPKMTIGEMRGKILVMSRDQYAKTPIGGYIQSWSHSENFNDQRRSTFKAPNNRTEVAMIQDFYDLTGENGSERKKATVLTMLDRSMRMSSSYWSVNHTSGYTRSASSDGNRENARNTNGVVLDYLADESHSGRAGIVMMDFAGVDRSGDYDVRGLALTKAVIEQNRRYLSIGTGIGKTCMEAGKTISVNGNTVTANGEISAYAPDGRKIASGTGSLVLPANGTYIIKSEGETATVHVTR